MQTKITSIFAFLLLFLFNTPNTLAQLQLNGQVLEINSGKTPVANVKVRSDSTNSILSNSSGLFTLKFQEKYAGQTAYLWAENQDWELVNEADMYFYLPLQNQAKHLDVIVCRKGYLEQAREEYLNITVEYITKEFNKKYDPIFNQKDKGWQKELAYLEEKLIVLKRHLEKQADTYIRTNHDILSSKEIKAIKLFEAGKIDESLRVRESLNSEVELTKQLGISELVNENSIRKESKKRKVQTAINLHRRNLRREADLFILKFQFDSAECKLRALAEIDKANFKSVSALGEFLATQNKKSEAIEVYEKALKLAPIDLDVAMTLNILSVLYHKSKEYKKAQESTEKAMEIRQRLKIHNPQMYYSDVAKMRYAERTLDNTFSDYTETIEKINARLWYMASLNSMIDKLKDSEKIYALWKIILRSQEIQSLGMDMSSSLGESYGKLAWFQLFENDFEGAENSAQEALNPTTYTTSEGYKEEIEWVYTNLALALLFQGKYDAAKTIYLDLKDKPINRGTYKDLFLEDLEVFEYEGVTHPDVERIRELLGVE